MILSQEIDKQGDRQKKYCDQPFDWNFLSMESRIPYLKMALMCITEETTEVARELTEGYHRYKPFKPSSPVNEKKLIDEIADIYIWANALAAMAGFTGEEVEEAIAEKLNYNTIRDDHL